MCCIVQRIINIIVWYCFPNFIRIILFIKFHIIYFSKFSLYCFQ
nr:MAG TPA: hypothetical protein [Caudoviricetes sp.]